MSIRRCDLSRPTSRRGSRLLASTFSSPFVRAVSVSAVLLSSWWGLKLVLVVRVVRRRKRLWCEVSVGVVCSLFGTAPVCGKSPTNDKEAALKLCDGVAIPVLLSSGSTCSVDIRVKIAWSCSRAASGSERYVKRVQCPDRTTASGVRRIPVCLA